MDSPLGVPDDAAGVSGALWASDAGALLRHVVSQAPVGVAVLDPQYRFQVCNRVLSDLDGVSVEDHIGRTVAQVMPAAWPAVQPFIDRAMAGEAARFEIPSTRHSTEAGPRWWQISVYPIRGEADQVIAVGALLLDITERKRASAAREDFMGLVSHELRTPLTSIIGFGARLERQADVIERDELREDLRVMLGEAERLRGIVQNMLSYASGPSEAPSEPYDLRVVIGRAVSRHTARRPGRVDVDVPAELPKMLGRTVQIEQVLLNLLDNAAKYSPLHGRIELCAVRTEDSVHIFVRDQGRGLDGADPEPLFEPFVRSASTRRLVPGVGLGLSVARRNVVAHGGQIWLRQRTEGGAEAGFSLPVPEPPLEA